MTPDTSQPEKPKDLAGWPKAAVDYGPLLVFFGANAKFGIIAATGCFMAAFAVALVYSLIKTGRVSPMMWFIGVIVGIFGGLTLYFNDQFFIKIKGTIQPVLFGILLVGAHLLGRAPLKSLLGQAMPPLQERGWAILTWGYAIFFFAMAGLNEVLRRILTDNQYVSYATWGDMGLTFIVMMALGAYVLTHFEVPEAVPKAVPEAVPEAVAQPAPPANS